MTDAADVMAGQGGYDLIEAEFNAVLDGSLSPAGPGTLFGYVAEMGLPAGAAALDVGCGEGEYALELSRRFGLRVTGVDPVRRCVEAARSAADARDSVVFASGTAENLPVPDASADLVWCRDVLCLVGDLGAAYREFRRVLKPGGRALVYQMFATPLLEPADAAFLLPALGCSPSAMRPENTDAAITAAGLRIDERAVLGTQWGEYAQEHARQPGRHLLHAARLLRDPDRYIALRQGELRHQARRLPVAHLPDDRQAEQPRLPAVGAGLTQAWQPSQVLAGFARGDLAHKVQRGDIHRPAPRRRDMNPVMDTIVPD